MNFKELVPEMGVPGPNQSGKMTPLDKMRHREMVLLGMAFGLDFDWEMRREDLLPLMKSEEAKGTFGSKKPVDLRAWARLSNPTNPHEWPEASRELSPGVAALRGK